MALIDWLISASLALIMFGIGLSISVDQFREIFSRPKPLVLGLVLQIIFLPLVFFTLLILLPLEAVMKMGFFIVALCPGGTTSNFISYLVKASAALSISITAVNSLFVLITLPVLSQLGMQFFLGDQAEVSLSLQQTLWTVLWVLIIPAALGVITNKFLSKKIGKLEKPLRQVNILLFALVYGIKFFAPKAQGGSGLQLASIMSLLPSALLLHLVTMIGAFLIAKLLKVQAKESTTIGIEVGLQNTTLALLVTATMLSNETMSHPALVFAMFSFFTTLAFGWFTLHRPEL